MAGLGSAVCLAPGNSPPQKWTAVLMFQQLNCSATKAVVAQDNLPRIGVEGRLQKMHGVLAGRLQSLNMLSVYNLVQHLALCLIARMRPSSDAQTVDRRNIFAAAM